MSDGTTQAEATAAAAATASAETEELLRAGAVLPPGTAVGDGRAVAVLARAYRHPVLDGRTVVRLAPDDGTLDQGAGFLGLVPAGPPVEVGVGRPRTMGFPEWIMVRHPSDSHLAMSVAEEMDTIARRVRSQAKRARAAYESIGARLAGSVPHFLPTFYEEAGRVFLAADQTAYASQMFVNARKAETAHGLPFDEARMDAVFLEFALAGAVPTKILSSYAKGLPSRVPAATAFRHLRGLFVRLAAHGVPPSSPGASDLRRLAKAAAGKHAQGEEMAYLREMLPLPGTAEAPVGWWKAHRAALLELARREPSVRGTLLGVLPAGWERDELPQWLELLEESGATAGLCDAALPAEERSPDGTAGWMRRFVALCKADRYQAAPPELYPLVDRAATVLRAELLAAGEELAPPVGDVNLLDQLLALGVPVAPPTDVQGLALGAWGACAYRRDLRALAADGRFLPAFLRGHLGRSRESEEQTLLDLARSPGGRPMLASWVEEVSRRHLTMTVPELAGPSGPLSTLPWLPGEVLAVAADAVRDALTTGIAPALARTLRTGIVDELGWPAWEEAMRSAASRGKAQDVTIVDCWPYLIVLCGEEIRVLDTEGTLLSREARLPDGPDRPSSFACQYVDGALFVWWDSYAAESWQGYWHGVGDSPILTVRGWPDAWWPCDPDGSRGRDGRLAPASLPLPGGGRTTGRGVLRRGDAVLPGTRPLISDGTSYWVLAKKDGQDWLDETPVWRTYDPAGDTVGGPGVPQWIDEALRGAPEGSTLGAAWLLPAPSAAPGPLCAPVDGVLGWRVVSLPDGSRRGEDLAGRTVVVPPGVSGDPEHALVFPGTDRPVAVIRKARTVELLDADGRRIAEIPPGYWAGNFNAGTPRLPHLRYWHHLQPRDPQGSAALRRIDDATAAALLSGAVATLNAGPDERKERAGTDGRSALSGLVRTHLPEVGDDALRAGICGVLRVAAGQQRILDSALSRLDAASAGAAPQTPSRPEPDDKLLEAALNGVGLTRQNWFHRNARYYRDQHHFSHLPRLLGHAMRGTAEPAPPDRTGVIQPAGQVSLKESLDRLDAVALPELPAILALRAGSECTVAEHREALDALLEVLDAEGLTELDPGHWRRVRLRLDGSVPEEFAASRTEDLQPLTDGAFLVFPSLPRHIRSEPDPEDDPRPLRYGALFHDPAGRFEIPEWYTLLDSGPAVPEPVREQGWAAAFRAELAARGPAPWFPAAAEEFARLTGVSPSMARLVVAGLPRIDDPREAVPAATLKTIGVTAADARVAKDEFRTLDPGARQAVVAALFPADPARLWTDGPDAARAAQVWNTWLGRRTPVSEELLHDTVRSVASPGWAPYKALYGFAGLDTEPRLTRDLTRRLGPHALRFVEGPPGFDNHVLKGSVALAAWLAHRLPAGDPLRAVLPRVLTAVRDRLAHPGLLLPLDRRIDREAWRRAAGEPTETDEAFVRYGAVVLGTSRYDPVPMLRPALLDPAGDDDAYASTFAGERPNAQETALRLVHDRQFAELLADPGDPVAGERDADGLWWPQDPARSVPDLVDAVATAHGLGADAAVLYLMLLAMPDPTDRNTARWTGWGQQRGGTARLRAARAELAATDLVVEGNRSKAGRSLFLPGGWTRLSVPHLPLERWKLPMYGLLDRGDPVLGVVVPTRPVADLYRHAWQRVLDGDAPRLEELEVPRPHNRRR